MIDPKMLELSVYEGIPHLLTPVVTDMRDAVAGVWWRWSGNLRLMATLGVRDVAGYNAKVQEAVQKRHAIYKTRCRREGDDEQKQLQELPQIVVLADEFCGYDGCGR